MATCFVKRLMRHKANNVSVIRAHAERDFQVADFQVEGHLKFALARLLVAQDEHRQAVHREAPHHAEGVGLAQQEDDFPG